MNILKLPLREIPDLPSEIWDQVVSLMDVRSCIRLAATSRRFRWILAYAKRCHVIIPPINIDSRDIKQAIKSLNQYLHCELIRQTLTCVTMLEEGKCFGPISSRIAQALLLCPRLNRLECSPFLLAAMETSLQDAQWNPLLQENMLPLLTRTSSLAQPLHGHYLKKIDTLVLRGSKTTVRLQRMQPTHIIARRSTDYCLQVDRDMSQRKTYDVIGQDLQLTGRAADRLQSISAGSVAFASNSGDGPMMPPLLRFADVAWTNLGETELAANLTHLAISSSLEIRSLPSLFFSVNESCAKRTFPSVKTLTVTCNAISEMDCSAFPCLEKLTLRLAAFPDSSLDYSWMQCLPTKPLFTVAHARPISCVVFLCQHTSDLPPLNNGDVSAGEIYPRDAHSSRAIPIPHDVKARITKIIVPSPRFRKFELQQDEHCFECALATCSDHASPARNVDLCAWDKPLLQSVPVFRSPVIYTQMIVDHPKVRSIVRSRPFAIPTFLASSTNPSKSVMTLAEGQGRVVTRGIHKHSCHRSGMVSDHACVVKTDRVHSDVKILVE